MPEGFATKEEAARAALAEAMPLSERWEYAGVIYEKDGIINYTKPVTNKERADVKVTVNYPKGATVLGLYHTHPEGKKSNLFSETDINVAKQLGLPYFMGDVATGDMRVFNYGQTKVRTRRGFKRSSEGHLLGNLFEKLVPTRRGRDILIEGPPR